MKLQCSQMEVNVMWVPVQIITLFPRDFQWGFNGFSIDIQETFSSFHSQFVAFPIRVRKIIQTQMLLLLLLLLMLLLLLLPPVQ